MATKPRKQGHGKHDQPQDQEAPPSTQAQPESGEKLDSRLDPEDITRTARSALGDLPDRMARIVREQGEQETQRAPSDSGKKGTPRAPSDTKEQGAQRAPSDKGEREPAQQTAEHSVQRSDEGRMPRHKGEMRPEEARPDHDGQGDKTMATDESNPTYAARAGLLRMARQWRDTGSTHQAIKAYEEILTNYPGTQVAAAATEELVQLAQMMEDQGQFHSALEVFKKLEQYGVGR